MEKKSLMSDNSGYYIHAFMRNVLDLKGCELNTYAVIYSFSKDGQGCFYGSREYLADCVGVSTDSIDRALKRLIKKKLIIKNTETTSKGITNYYTANLEMINSHANKDRNTEPTSAFCGTIPPQNAEPTSAKCGTHLRNLQNPTIYIKEYNTLSPQTTESAEKIEISKEERERVPYTSSSKPKKQEFTPPTLEQVLAYIEEKKLNTDGEEFYDYYCGVGWISGKKKIVDWKAILRQWAKKHQKEVLTRTSYGYAPVEFNNF